MVMVKPALPTSTSSRACARRLDLPVAAYHVCGEYAMIKAAAAERLDRRGARHARDADSIKRAGADLILTYHAIEAARALNA